MSAVGYVTEFDAMPTRPLGVLRWIARCWMTSDERAEALVPHVKELCKHKHTKPWSLNRWNEALGFRGGAAHPGGYVRKALVMAGLDDFDRGPLLYRWDFTKGKYESYYEGVR